MENKLLPCPFCGSEAELKRDGNSWTVGCVEKDKSVHWCMAYQSLTVFATQHEAIAAWNTRHEAAKSKAGEGDGFNLNAAVYKCEEALQYTRDSTCRAFIFDAIALIKQEVLTHHEAGK